MNTFIIPALTVALPSIGFIAGALFAGGQLKGLREDVEALRTEVADDDLVIQSQGREIAYFRAERNKRLAPLHAANAKRSAEATAARHLRMEAAEQRSAMKQAAE